MGLQRALTRILVGSRFTPQMHNPLDQGEIKRKGGNSRLF
jgi:hypothetical protein